MRKNLANIEDITEFFLALANGADINGTYKGQTVIECFFDRIYNDAERYFFNRRLYFGYYSVLAISGADVSPILLNKTKQLENIIYWTSRCVDLLTVLSECESFYKVLIQRYDFSNLKNECTDFKTELEKTVYTHSQKPTPSISKKEDTEISAVTKARITLIASGTDVSPQEENRLVNQYASAAAFDKCMLKISGWDNDVSFDEIREMIDSGFDFTELFNDDWNPPFTISNLLKRTLEFLQMIRITVNAEKPNELADSLCLLSDSLRKFSDTCISNACEEECE